MIQRHFRTRVMIRPSWSRRSRHATLPPSPGPTHRNAHPSRRDRVRSDRCAELLPLCQRSTDRGRHRRLHRSDRDRADSRRANWRRLIRIAASCSHEAASWRKRSKIRTRRSNSIRNRRALTTIEPTPTTAPRATRKRWRTTTRRLRCRRVRSRRRYLQPRAGAQSARRKRRGAPGSPAGGQARAGDLQGLAKRAH